jgi:hypothetical protein
MTTNARKALGLRLIPIGSIALYAAALTGCAAVIEALQPPPPQPVTVSFTMPSIVPVEGASQTVVKSGITISAAPVEYTEIADTKIEGTETGRGISCRRLQNGIEVTPVRFISVVNRPEFRVTPDHLEFLVKINNQLPRVFRGAGTLVQFNVDGRLISTTQAAYVDLSNLILPPRNEAELRVRGPSLSSLTDGAVVGLFLYDVATNMDGAGNVTEKQNFEWYYTYHAQTLERTGTITRTRREEPVGRAQIKERCQ